MIKLFVGNHVRLTGISDIINLIQQAGKFEDLNFEISNDLSNGTCMFIDEFSSIYELKMLARKKQLNSLKYILLSTEFETNSYSGPSFNEFTKPYIGLPFIVRFLGPVLFWTPKLVRYSVLFGKFTAVLGLLIILPYLILHRRNNYKDIVDFITEIKRRVYMKTRRIGYEKFKNIADLIIKIHPAIDKDKKTLLLLPIIENFKNDNTSTIRVSGTETLYRLNQCDNFKNFLIRNNLNFKFDYKEIITFDELKPTKNYGYAYQPAQTQQWDKSNPVKIWRDIHYHGAIPILDKKFGDHPIESVAITCEEFFMQDYDHKTIRQNVCQFSQNSKKMNSFLFSKIKELELS